MKQQQLLSLVDDIYTAATEPAHWKVVTSRLQNAIGGNSAGLAFEDQTDKRLNFGISTTLDIEDMACYQEKFMFTDEVWSIGKHAKPGDVWLTQDYFNKQTLTSLSVFKNFYNRFDHHLFNCILLYRANGVQGALAVSRSFKDKPFSPEEKLLMQQLAPHLQRAVAVNKQLVDSGFQSPLLSSLTDKLSVAVLLLNEKGKIRFYNQRAEALYQRGILTGDTISFRICDQRASSKLEAKIETIAKAQDIPVENMDVIQPFMDSDGNRYIVCCLPYRPLEQKVDLFGSHLSAMVFILEQNDTFAIPIESLRKAYDITRAESRVLQLLTRFLSVEEIADQLCISEATVRFHLKNLFSKTGTKRQSELQGLVMKTLGKLSFP